MCRNLPCNFLPSDNALCPLFCPLRTGCESSGCCSVGAAAARRMIRRPRAGPSNGSRMVEALAPAATPCQRKARVMSPVKLAVTNACLCCGSWLNFFLLSRQQGKLLSLTERTLRRCPRSPSDAYDEVTPRACLRSISNVGEPLLSSISAEDLEWIRRHATIWWSEECLVADGKAVGSRTCASRWACCNPHVWSP